jgi:hypothetical protein
LVAILASGACFSQDEPVIMQSTNASFLNQAMSARAIGMGEAYTAVADEPSAILWNPAGTFREKAVSVIASHGIIEQGMGISYVAVSFPASRGIMGAGLSVFSLGSYDVRDERGNAAGMDSASDYSAMLSWAMEIPEGLNVIGSCGLAVEYAHEAIGESCWGMNAGLVLPYGRLFDVGIALRHLGPAVDDHYMPMSAGAGVKLNVSDNTIFAGDLRYGLVDKSIQYKFGGEARILNWLALRAGYKWQRELQDWNGLKGVCAGLGFCIGAVFIDYAYQPFGDFMLVHHVSLTYRAKANPQDESAEDLPRFTGDGR